MNPEKGSCARGAGHARGTASENGSGCRVSKRYVVLGGGGFIGSHLLDALLSQGRTDIVVVDTASDKIAHHRASPRLSLVEGATTEPRVRAALEAEIPGADAVINLAAICNPAQYTSRALDTMRANAIDIFPLVDLCAAHGRWLLHFSTSEVYGRTLRGHLSGGGDRAPDDGAGLVDIDEFAERTTPLVMGPVHNQRWCYAAAKQLVERYIFAHGRESGMPWTIVRPFNFFGPRMDYLQRTGAEGTPRVLASFLSALLYGRPIQLVDGGTARRTVVAIEDAIDAVLRMLARPGQAQGEIFNIGNRDNEVSMRELALLMRRLFAEVTGDPRAASHPVASVPAEAFYGAGYEDCDRRMPRLERARELLGWEPKRGLEDTLRATIADLVATHQSERMPLEASSGG